MFKKTMTWTLMTAALLFVVGLAFAAGEADKCAMCGMGVAEHQNTLYEITSTDGKAVTYCCPHCGLWEQAAAKDKVKAARAKDFIGGSWMDASKMFYVSGSSAVPACGPSWIAFGKKAEAEKFVKGFGGKVVGFDEALKERAKQPKAMEMPK